MIEQLIFLLLINLKYLYSKIKFIIQFDLKNIFNVKQIYIFIFNNDNNEVSWLNQQNHETLHKRLSFLI
jgi:hypothetical protein